MSETLEHHPSELELALSAPARHQRFHREIEAKAAALRGTPVPSQCEPISVSPPVFFKEAWFMIEGVSAGSSVTMRLIKQAVCDHFCLDIKTMVTGRRCKNEVIPRQVAMYLCKELTSQSLPQIGRNFGGSDHTTVLHACKRVPIYCERPEFKAVVDKLRAGLEALL